MNEIINVAGTDLTVKTWKNQRVVTFKDIDEVHKRPEGTARDRFNDNKKRFIKGEDYFVITPEGLENAQLSEIHPIGIDTVSPRGTTFVTESGYLMLVKSFTDDLAWDVQRKLVNTYFKTKEVFAITEQQYNELLENYNNLVKQVETLSDDLLLLSARMDGYDEGKVLLDKEKAEFIKDATDTLKEMMPDFGYEGEKYGKMLSDVIAKMEEIDRVPFSYYTDAYLKQKNLDKVNNRLEVIAEYDELQDLFYSAIKCIYNNKLIPFDLSGFGNVLTGEELLNGYI